jgi:hypothetical protein
MSQELEKRITNALEAYHAAKKPNIAFFAREFNIPYSTFKGRVKGRQPRKGSTGGTKALEPEQEQALILWIDILDQGFSPPNASQIQGAAEQIIQRHDPSRTLGKNWAYRFIDRLPPRFRDNSAKLMEKDRYQAVTPGFLASWYDRLDITIKTYEITERNLYNFDETGFRIGQGKPENVISARGNYSNPTGGPTESLTGIECVSADGWVMPPWFLVKGQFHMENWYINTNLPDDYTVCPTKNGWTDEIVSFEWVQCFHEFTKHRTRNNQYRLLLMDNHGSHLTYDFVEFCWENRIIPYCFIPHTTHICQPLDDVPFQVLKHYYRSANNNEVFWGGDIKQKADFFAGIHDVRVKSLTSRTIRHGFRECGIWPIDSRKGLIKSGFGEDNDLPTMPGFIVHDIASGSTPPPPSSSLPNSPPATVQKLRKASAKVSKHIQNDISISPKIREGLTQILAGGLTLAEAGAQFAEDNVRVIRRKKQNDTTKTKRRIPELGPRLVKHCKKRIEERADRERLQTFNKVRRQWERAAILRAIADGEIDNSGVIESDDDEDRSQELIDDLYYIDTAGDVI